MTEYLKFKKSNCKNCYKCIRHCPVKSIRFSENQANIVSEECILCGHCFVACPQNAKEIRNDIPAAKALLKSGTPVYASIAPSFIANYHNAAICSIEKALRHLGFAGAEETAAGATIVKKQYDLMIEKASQDVIISSCCHTVNLLIQKYYPKVLPYLAHVISPMQAHCMDIKRRFPGAKTVFIGPCISKKAEAESYSGLVDCVLTFEELSLWLNEEKITLEFFEDTINIVDSVNRVNIDYAVDAASIADAVDKADVNNIAHSADVSGKSRARLFPTTGGILKTMEARNPDYTYMAIDGIENCTDAIKDIINGKIKKCFIEMSACSGSCIGGPAMDKNHRSPVSDYISVNKYAGKKDFEVAEYSESQLKKSMPSLAPRHVYLADEAIAEVLKKMNKTKPEHELNCGSCGYNTCRDKAKAVLEGKADMSMCLLYLKEKAESFSDNIIKNTPNAIIVLNETLEVQQINAAACKLMNIRSPQDVLGDQVVCILDPLPFIEAYQKGKNIYYNRIYLADYCKYVDQTVIYDKSYHI